MNIKGKLFSTFFMSVLLTTISYGSALEEIDLKPESTTVLSTFHEGTHSPFIELLENSSHDSNTDNQQEVISADQSFQEYLAAYRRANMIDMDAQNDVHLFEIPRDVIRHLVSFITEQNNLNALRLTCSLFKDSIDFQDTSNTFIRKAVRQLMARDFILAGAFLTQARSLNPVCVPFRVLEVSEFKSGFGVELKDMPLCALGSEEPYWIHPDKLGNYPMIEDSLFVVISNTNKRKIMNTPFGHNAVMVYPSMYVDYTPK